METESFVVPPPADVSLEHRVVDHPLPPGTLDPDAVKVVRRLEQFGHEVYLVGGCVRDILLGVRPKDFDVATSAMPAEVRKLFRNCRLIGRRFRLAHILFRDRKVIEVATFRRGATEADDVTERHAAENLFGGPADDAVRRDFTINALMYDVSRRRIVDWVGGLDDLERKTIRTIGDPVRRLTEDPVRIIRAVKFAGRLGFVIESSLAEALRGQAPSIAGCAPARLVEEVLKLLRSGKAAPCFSLAGEMGILAHLLPGIEGGGGPVPDDRWEMLSRADAWIGAGRPLSDPVLLAALAHPLCAPALEADGDPAENLEAALERTLAPLTFTRFQLARLRQIFLSRRRLLDGPRTKRARRIAERDYAAEAVDFLELADTFEEQPELVASWRDLIDRRPASPQPEGEPGPQPEGTESRGRRPRRRRRGGRRPPSADPAV
ncbi:MAG TPA: polynucleotide adenylyltransferase PcnB [Polyangia bacterium]|nr:polynucleotide adenylyltransferase PcnB [Polyangia bacterium]